MRRVRVMGALKIAVVLCAGTVLAAAQRSGSQDTTAAGSDAPVFENVAVAARLHFSHVNGASAEKHLIETMGSGGLLFDVDADGWLDVFVVDGGSVVDNAVNAKARHRLYRNRRDGTFEDITGSSSIVHRDYGLGACAADYDRDGDVDLYVTTADANVLYRNAGSGTFVDVTAVAGVGSGRLSTSCAFADFDNDGDADLFVVNYVDPAGNTKVCGNGRIRAYCRPDVYAAAPDVVYANDGDGTFTDVTARAGLNKGEGKGLGVVTADYDADGRIDVFVANDLTPNFLYHNDGDWKFSEVALLAGVAVASDGKIRAGMGTDFGDYTGDGLLDLVVTNFELETHNLFRNLGGGLFADATVDSGIGVASLPFLGFGAGFFDYDNDGDLDLAIANGHVLDNTQQFRSTSKYAQRNMLLRNDGAGRLRDVAGASGSGFAVEKVSRALVTGDIDNDGDLDVLVTNNGQSLDLLRNDGAHGNAVTVKLVGTTSNRDGLGARVRATAGGRTQLREVKAGSSYLGQNDTRVHLGVGRASQIDRLEVRWPSGTSDVATGVAVQQIITITEGKGVTTTANYQRPTSK